MKLSDYVTQFLVDRGVTHIFGMSGGAAVHLFDSVNRNPKIEYICSQHEQNAAMSADGYARTTGKMGVAVTTSGPGATNLLTGTCCSFFDSVPTLMITGQVATHRLKGHRTIRQLGFQETDVISIFSSVTKYCAQVKSPDDIRYHLEAAWYWAFEGRPGSVLIDIPDDLQRAIIDPDRLQAFTAPSVEDVHSNIQETIDNVVQGILEADRPVIILGGGLSTPRIDKEVSALIEELNVPVLSTWAGLDLISHDHPLRVGSFGVYAPRLGNFAIQNADFILCLGSRLSQNVTGGILSFFARDACIAMFDVDSGEMDKFDNRGIEIDYRINGRLDVTVPLIRRALVGRRRRSISDWAKKIKHWREILPDDLSASFEGEPRDVDAYKFLDLLSDYSNHNEIIFVDTGGNLTWTCNGLRLQGGQRLISAWNNTPMGYSLPAAIGAAVNGISPVTCIIGDGGLLICPSELATLLRHNLNIRVLIFDNKGHGIQKQTLATWFDGKEVAVDKKSGLALPDIPKLCRAMDLPVFEIKNINDAKPALEHIYAQQGPTVCVVHINPDQKLYPVLKFGAALEDQLPSLGADFIYKEMVVSKPDPIKASLDGTPGV